MNKFITSAVISAGLIVTPVHAKDRVNEIQDLRNNTIERMNQTCFGEEDTVNVDCIVNTLREDFHDTKGRGFGKERKSKTVLALKDETITYYRNVLTQELLKNNISLTVLQYILQIDTNTQISGFQNLSIWLYNPSGKNWEEQFIFIGASKISGGKADTKFRWKDTTYQTPQGIIYVNPYKTWAFPYRAIGTGKLEYGLRWTPVRDIGLQKALWPDGKEYDIRFMIHGTSPWTEERLWKARSHWCARSPEHLGIFLEKYGILNAGFKEAYEKFNPMKWYLWHNPKFPKVTGEILIIKDIFPEKSKKNVVIGDLYKKDS